MLDDVYEHRVDLRKRRIEELRPGDVLGGGVGREARVGLGVGSRGGGMAGLGGGLGGERGVLKSEESFWFDFGREVGERFGKKESSRLAALSSQASRWGEQQQRKKRGVQREGRGAVSRPSGERRRGAAQSSRSRPSLLAGHETFGGDAQVEPLGGLLLLLSSPGKQTGKQRKKEREGRERFFLPRASRKRLPLLLSSSLPSAGFYHVSGSLSNVSVLYVPNETHRRHDGTGIGDLWCRIF